MPQFYDNWERLVRATLRREQLRLIALRTPSDLSLASCSSSSFSFKVPSFLVGEAFDYDQISRASNYFTNSNLINRGHSGDLFRGILYNGGPVVIRRIDFSSAKDELSCLTELEFFGKVSHPRFVPLIGHCFDNSKYKFLVYKHMSNGDLESLISSKVDDNDHPGRLWDLVRKLDWFRRLKIAIAVAEALCHLHHECFPPLVHRDVQARSILLDDNYEGRLGSLSYVCAQQEEKQKENNQSKQNATCAYDVYCFGKVLLELVLGRQGISASGNAAMRDWLKHALPYSWIPERVAAMMYWLEQTVPYNRTYEKTLILKMVDTCLILDKDSLEEVWGMAIVARSCLNPKPFMRPCMEDVLRALENPFEVVKEEYTSEKFRTLK